MGNSCYCYFHTHWEYSAEEGRGRLNWMTSLNIP
jgi:hypothetical protein